MPNSVRARETVADDRRSGRNNPLRYIGPDGMDVTLGKCALGSTQECFERVQQGLRPEDREHVHLVEGNGRNGFKKGEHGVTVDADYKSDSKNFRALQTLAGDHSATATIDVLKPNEKFDVRVTVSFNRDTGAEQTATMGTAPKRVVSPATRSIRRGKVCLVDGTITPC